MGRTPSPGGVSPLQLLRTTLSAATSLISTDGGAVQPAPGLWALTTARCPPPAGTDLNGWADCTQPLGLNGGELAVLEKPSAGNKAEATGGLFSIARTRYRIAPLAGGSAVAGLPAPALVQVETPGLSGRSYVYIALQPEIIDADGRFVSARAWPVACPPPGSAGVARRGERCVASSLRSVIEAASAVPADGGYVLRWVDPADASSAGDTSGGRVYAPAPRPVYRAPRRLSPVQAAEPLPISELPPELAAQQPQVQGYAPGDDGEGDAPLGTPPRSGKGVPKPAARSSGRR